MQKIIKVWLERSCFFFAIVCTLLILILSLVRTDYFPTSSFSHIDKLEHCIAYTVLTFFWLITVVLKKPSFSIIYTIGLIISYGVLIEFLQVSLTSYRSGDVLDFIANSIGVLIGYIFFKLLDSLYLEV